MNQFHDIIIKLYFTESGLAILQAFIFIILIQLYRQSTFLIKRIREKCRVLKHQFPARSGGLVSSEKMVLIIT